MLDEDLAHGFVPFPGTACVEEAVAIHPAF
jgi:hypothetical protein